MRSCEYIAPRVVFAVPHIVSSRTYILPCLQTFQALQAPNFFPDVPSKYSVVLIPLSSLSNIYFYTRFSQKLLHLTTLRTNDVSLTTPASLNLPIPPYLYRLQIVLRPLVSCMTSIHPTSASVRMGSLRSNHRQANGHRSIECSCIFRSGASCTAS